MLRLSKKIIELFHDVYREMSQLQPPPPPKKRTYDVSGGKIDMNRIPKIRIRKIEFPTEKNRLPAACERLNCENKIC